MAHGMTRPTLDDLREENDPGVLMRERAEVHARSLLGALIEIARGKECKNPLPAVEAQRIAKAAISAAGMDWCGRKEIALMKERKP